MEYIADILSGLLVMASIGAVLALLLEIAGAYIANYGDKHILINNQKDLVIEGGNPLLFSLMSQNIYIPSACGGKGTCSYCKVKIHEGGGPLLPTELTNFEKVDIKDGIRLSCQVKVKEDMKIEIPDELFLIREFRAVVEKTEDLTPTNKGIVLRIISPEDGLTFKPGQYIQLQVPPSKLSDTSEFRAYSIASSASDHMRIELVITKVEGGSVSTYVHEYLKKGDEVIIRGPFGDFFLRDSDREMLFIATGSGLAPIISILHQIQENRITRKATLFFGDRKTEDLYYEDQLKSWQNSIDNFTYTPTLSRTTEEENWTGEVGRVTNLIEKYIPDDAPVDVYICGAPPMVDSCAQLLKQKGIPAANVFYDKFE